jgi:hypothetical protein
MSCGIIFIARNEGKYLDEWLRYHKGIGIGKFICHLDKTDSDDGSREILKKHGAVIYDGFKPPYQIDFYWHAFHAHRAEAEYFAVIDVDEFIVPDGGRLPDNMPYCVDMKSVTIDFNDESEIDMPLLERNNRVTLRFISRRKQIIRSDAMIFKEERLVHGPIPHFGGIVLHHHYYKTRTEFDLRNSFRNNASENHKRGVYE